MLNKLTAFLRQYDMLQPGDTVTCAVSGGADSIALLWAFYLLREKLGIQLAAAHFNHGLRGEESDRDEAFVRQFCQDRDIPFMAGHGTVEKGKKGLEAAARDARYGFLNTISGKIATAHTADDNAETVLLHLVRGTGLKGLGGIAPVNGRYIRPMLGITRQEVETFLREYYVNNITDSSNESDAFLRNRLRHHVIPLLKQENPRLAENLSAMALRLRQDEAALTTPAQTDVTRLRQMQPANRSRSLAALLTDWGIREPEAEHIALVEKLVFSDNPSGYVQLPGGVSLRRNYDRLEKGGIEEAFAPVQLLCPGEVTVSGYRISCIPSEEIFDTPDHFTVLLQGPITLRPRQTGDRLCTWGGSKSVKKLFIDRKIPAANRGCIPVLADKKGIIGVCGIGPNLHRLGRGAEIIIQKEEKYHEK